MTKLLGTILVIGVTSMTGILAGEQIKEQYRQVRYLQKLLYRLQSEIRYTRSFFGEVFYHISREAVEPYKSWLMEMYQIMDEKREGTLQEIWEMCCEKHLRKTALPTLALEKIKYAGGALGSADMEQQMRTFALLEEDIQMLLDEIHEEMKMKIRLCHCLGVMSGLFITILLI